MCNQRITQSQGWTQLRTHPVVQQCHQGPSFFRGQLFISPHVFPYERPLSWSLTGIIASFLSSARSSLSFRDPPWKGRVQRPEFLLCTPGNQWQTWVCFHFIAAAIPSSPCVFRRRRENLFGSFCAGSGVSALLSITGPSLTQ